MPLYVFTELMDEAHFKSASFVAMIWKSGT